MCQYYTKKTDRRPYEKFADGKIVCIEDEIPFDLPNGWAWTRLGQVFELISGRDLEPEDYNNQEDGLPYITGASCLSENGVLLKRWTPRPSVFARHGDLLLVCKGAGYGKTSFCDIPEAHIARQIMAIRCSKLLNLKYLRAHLVANIQCIKRFGQGLIPGIDRTSVLSMIIPLPPLTEQKRIVSKIEELFAEAEKISVAVDGVTRVVERINKKVLDLAIRGQLVPQDPNDEPAEKLLQRIAEARQHSANIKSRKLKSEGSVIFCGADRSAYETRNGKTVCIDDEIPFDIPDSWAWIRFGVLIDIIAGVSYQKDDVTTTGVRILRGGNIKADAHIYLNNEDVFLSQQYADPATTIRKGDVVIVASTGSSTVIGRPAIASADMPSVQIGAFLRILRAKDESVREWLPVIVLGDYYRKHVREQSKGTNIKNLKAEYLNEMLIPLPPLAEQKRIVAKIECIRTLAELIAQT